MHYAVILTGTKSDMATLTIRNLPDDVYQALRDRARRRKRSINREAIFQLETSIGTREVDIETELEEIREFRESLKGVYATEAGINAAKIEGRL